MDVFSWMIQCYPSNQSRKDDTFAQQGTAYPVDTVQHVRNTNNSSIEPSMKNLKRFCRAKKQNNNKIRQFEDLFIIPSLMNLFLVSRLFLTNHHTTN
jgi:hypothetical protein